MPVFAKDEDKGRTLLIRLLFSLSQGDNFMQAIESKLQAIESFVPQKYGIFHALGNSKESKLTQNRGRK